MLLPARRHLADLHQHVLVEVSLDAAVPWCVEYLRQVVEPRTLGDYAEDLRKCSVLALDGVTFLVPVEHCLEDGRHPELADRVAKVLGHCADLQPDQLESEQTLVRVAELGLPPEQPQHCPLLSDQAIAKVFQLALGPGFLDAAECCAEDTADHCCRRALHVCLALRLSRQGAVWGSRLAVRCVAHGGLRAATAAEECPPDRGLCLLDFFRLASLLLGGLLPIRFVVEVGK